MQENLVLDQFQQEAIDYSRQNYSIIVSAPTGAGKTLIAERIIEESIAKGKGVIYTAPIKALSNQKYRDFCKKYPTQTGILTGDVSINRNSPILIMTTEIFRNAIMVNPDEFADREWVIFDEIHYLDDIERGTVWEEAIILLPENMRMLALSATIPNIDQFSEWLAKVHKFPVKSVIEKKRPVPLHFFFQCNNDIFPGLKELKKANLVRERIRRERYQQNRYPFNVKPNKMSGLINHLKMTKGLPCIYFSFSRRRCEDLAQETMHYDFLNQNEKDQITSLFNNLTEKFSVTSQHCGFLYQLIRKGVAYHHAGLLPTVKEIIERLFTSGLLKMIFTTETFALGINMPARTVIFDELSKFYGYCHRYLKTRDFYQMAGRAGRRGIDTEGYVISRVNPQYIDMENLETIIYGRYEPINSQLNSCYATVLNLYKIMGEKIYDIYPKSFHFHQTQDWQKKDAISLLSGRINLLKNMGYIVDNKLTSKAELASNVYSFELIVGELFQSGFFETLSEEDLFIAIASLVYEPRKGERKPQLNKRVKKLKRELLIFSKTIHRIEQKFKIYPTSKKLYFNLSEAGQQWFEGKDFSKITKISQIDEGEIVRYFRMTIQVLRELYSCKEIQDNLRNKIMSCLKRVKRDEVDAEKQLRQEI